MTGGRIGQACKFLSPSEPFALTYGDGISNADTTALVAFNKSHGWHATVTAVQAPIRYGVLNLEGETVTAFRKNNKQAVVGLMVGSSYFNRTFST